MMIMNRAYINSETCNETEQIQPRIQRKNKHIKVFLILKLAENEFKNQPHTTKHVRYD